MDFPERQELSVRISMQNNFSQVRHAIRVKSWMASLIRLWERFATWTPSDAQIRRMAQNAQRWGDIADKTLKTAVVLIAIYFAFEIGWAFRPEGPAHCIFGGCQ
jgi:hypothetical protein